MEACHLHGRGDARRREKADRAGHPQGMSSTATSPTKSRPSNTQARTQAAIDCQTVAEEFVNPGRPPAGRQGWPRTLSRRGGGGAKASVHPHPIPRKKTTLRPASLPCLSHPTCIPSFRRAARTATFMANKEWRTGAPRCSACASFQSFSIKLTAGREMTRAFSGENPPTGLLQRFRIFQGVLRSFAASRGVTQ